MTSWEVLWVRRSDLGKTKLKPVLFTRVELTDVRCFQSQARDLGPLTVLVGPNNAGKSTILKSLATVQQGLLVDAGALVRAGAQRATVRIGLGDLELKGAPRGSDIEGWADRLLTCVVPVGTNVSMEISGTYRGEARESDLSLFKSSTPNNVILPFFAARRNHGFQQNVDESMSRQVTGNLSNLAQRLHQLHTQPRLWREYEQICDRLLGFHLVSIPVRQGELPGVVVDGHRPILADSLGDGVPTVAWLVAELIGAEGKLILIEEPEHDLHPTSLKELLDLMVGAMDRNQILVTTHSHVVLSTLGARGLVYWVDRQTVPEGAIPSSTVRRLETYEDRIRALAELGYTLGDMGLFEGWLILEEASAESVVRRLMEWFTPKLAQQVRTIAGGGVQRSGKMFDDYNRLFLFLHLEPRYKDRAWVVLDGDEVGSRTVERLKKEYAGWNPDCFRVWLKPQFEGYYPQRFDEQRSRISGLQGEQRQEAKKALAREVTDWMLNERDTAKAEFAESASEVVGFLRHLNEQIVGPAS